MRDPSALPRRLRREQTSSEAKLWERLRDRRLANAKFRRQHPVGRYVVDFACPEQRLIIELDGGVHRLREAEDFERQLTLEGMGWRLLRFPNEAVWSDFDNVLRAIERAVTHPAP